MKYFLSFFLVLQACNTKVEQAVKADVILKYIELHMAQTHLDPRLYNPPSPPELWDSLGRLGSKKPDSIIKKLKPLQVFVTKVVQYDSVFEPWKSPKPGYDFLSEPSKTGPKEVILDLAQIPKVKGMVLEGVSKEEFMEKYESIKLDYDYGGLYSFVNLFYSDDGKKAYFEVKYFKGKLDASSKAVYAQFIEGAWEYEVIPVSES